ncbi:DUF4097 family beta strand repeat-containing protein [Bacillus sp. 1P06AnD]|uniref:DUF4097 family beta strand repeat-containing protein n=1 Tax=Bacillus sp. 1P06AnD TaxID=3132208 RepID=UPI0039A26125
MNKKEFLDLLQTHLTNLSKDDVQDILYDFNEHFDNGALSGETEEQITAKLGDPLEIAQELCSIHPTVSTDPEEPAHATKESISSTTGERTTFNGAEINELHIDTNIYDITVTSTPFEEITIECSSSHQPSIKVAGDVLQCVSTHKSKLFFSFFNKTLYPELHIGIPSSGLKTLLIQTASGDVKLKQLTVEKVSLTSTNGDTTLNKVHCGHLTIKSQHGDIALQNSSMDDSSIHAHHGDLSLNDLTLSSSEAKVVYGDIDVSDVTAKEVVLATTHGDIEINDVTCAVIKCNSRHGDISLRHSHLASLHAETVSGCIEAQGNIERFQLQSISGDLRIEPHSLEQEAAATTVSGDIAVKVSSIPENTVIKASTLHGDCTIFKQKTSLFENGNHLNKVLFETVNGDIQVKAK